VAGVRGVPRRPGRDTDRTAPERSPKKKTAQLRAAAADLAIISSLLTKF
jgi:hypothetical protein